MRSIVSTTIALCVALSLAACGGDDAIAPPAAANNTPPVSDPVPPVPAPSAFAAAVAQLAAAASDVTEPSFIDVIAGVSFDAGQDTSDTTEPQAVAA